MGSDKDKGSLCGKTVMNMKANGIMTEWRVRELLFTMKEANSLEYSKMTTFFMAENLFLLFLVKKKS